MSKAIGVLLLTTILFAAPIGFAGGRWWYEAGRVVAENRRVAERPWLLETTGEVMTCSCPDSRCPRRFVESLCRRWRIFATDPQWAPPPGWGRP